MVWFWNFRSSEIWGNGDDMLFGIPNPDIVELHDGLILEFRIPSPGIENAMMVCSWNFRFRIQRHWEMVMIMMGFFRTLEFFKIRRHTVSVAVSIVFLVAHA